MAELQKIVKVTKAQYEILANGGTVGSYTGLNENYIYLVTNTTSQIGSVTIPVYVLQNGEFAPCEGFVVPAAGTANKILLGTASGFGQWSNGALSSSSTTPLYLNSAGILTAGSTYAGGTAVTLNGSSKGAGTASFYAPTTYGSTSQYLKGGGSGVAPTGQTLYAPTTVGSSGQVGRSNGTTPSWTTVYVPTTVGSSGQVGRSNGSTPSWTTVYIPTTTGTAGQLGRSNGSGGAGYTVFSYSNGVLTITNT